jgi:hypothetical protein
MDQKKHNEKVDKLADQMLAPEAELTVVHRTARDIAAEIDLYSDLVPDEMIKQDVFGADESTIYENIDAYDVFEGVVGEEILNPPAVLIDENERITYSSTDKRRLLHELGVNDEDDGQEMSEPTDIPRETIIRKSGKRIEPAELAAIEAAKTLADTEAHTVKKEKHHRRRRYPDHDEIKARKSMAILAGIVLIALYVFCFVYVAAVNREDSQAAVKKLRTLNSIQTLTKISKTDTSVSAQDKAEYKLSVYKLDSDNDGLSDYYELQYSATAPAIADTDGDGIPDGTELRAGTNPREVMSDGKTHDAQRTYVYSMQMDAVSVSVTGMFDIYGTVLDKYPLNTLNMPGILTPAYEINFPTEGMMGTFTVDLSRLNLGKWGPNNDAQIYRYNPDDGSMILVSGNAGDTGVISAVVGSGIYFAADRNYMSADGGTNIMFVIDNSGSMYSQDLVAGSEENDLEFERIAFAEDVINHVGDDVNFGVGKFTLRYKTLCGITDNDGAALAALSSIRTTAEDFDGTEISNSIISAINEFNGLSFDRNYIIAITDGLPSNIDPANEKRAIELAKTKNISVITIGLGKKIDADFLSVIAEETGGVYYQAVNNATFETISRKIEELLDSGRTTEIEQTSITQTEDGGFREGSIGTIKVLMLADSGFVVDEDTLSFKDIPTVNDKDGSDLGLAVFAKLYYSGALPLTESDYVTNSNVSVSGYNLSNSPFFTAGKQNLSDLELPKSYNYINYKTTIDRWDFEAIKDGLLPLSKMARETLEPIADYIKIQKGRFDWSGNEIRIPGFMRTITFQPQHMFNDYEYAALDVDSLANESAESDEYQTLRAVNFYNNFDDKGGVVWLSFGIDGKAAFDELESQLTLGIPAVIVADGRAYNAARLARSLSDPNELIIESFDPTNLYGMTTLIYLRATSLYDIENGYQYSAFIDNTPVNLYILKN